MQSIRFIENPPKRRTGFIASAIQYMSIDHRGFCTSMANSEIHFAIAPRIVFPEDI